MVVLDGTRRSQRRGRLLWRSLLVLLGMSLPNSACYTYRVASAEQLVPGTRVAFALTDRGRVDLSNQIGAGALRIDGTLADTTSNSYLLRVSAVRSIEGGTSRWGGESVALSREHVANVMRRDFSRSRTALAIAAVTAGVAAFIITRDLDVLGFGRDDRPPRPPPPGQ